MLFATIDVETSTKDNIPNPKTDEICELGLVVADWKSKTIISQFSQLYKVNTWNDESAKVHKIPKNMVANGSESDSIPNINDIIDLSKVEYIIAHNAAYDKNILARYWPLLLEKKWLCSLRDFEYPSTFTSKKLNHIAADYDLHTPGAHRALRDCLVVTELAFKYDLDEAWAKKNERKFNLISMGQYKEGIPERFKEHGWRWNSNDKYWHIERLNKQELKKNVEFVKSIGFKLSYEEVEQEY